MAFICSILIPLLHLTFSVLEEFSVTRLFIPDLQLVLRMCPHQPVLMAPVREAAVNYGGENTFFHWGKLWSVSLPPHFGRRKSQKHRCPFCMAVTAAYASWLGTWNDKIWRWVTRNLEKRYVKRFLKMGTDRRIFVSLCECMSQGLHCRAVFQYQDEQNDKTGAEVSLFPPLQCLFAE